MHALNDYVVLRELKLIIALVLCQIASGGVNIFYKLAVADGMKVEILIFYRLMFATASIAPLSLLIERNRRPKLTWTIVLQGLACGLFGGALGGNLYAESLVLTSATFATSMSNLIPALTFIMALIFRLEKLNIRKSTGKAKVIGTAIGISGAMAMTFYNGVTIDLWSTHINLVKNFEANPTVRHNHLEGSVLALLSCISYAACLIVQVKMSCNYPIYSSSALICFSGALLSAAYALCSETHLVDWKLGWNIRLISTAFMGIVGSGFTTVVMTWGTRVKGPLYISSFSPLSLIFVAVLASLLLNEKLHLGSIIGSVLIIVGLYIVLWGKYKEIEVPQLETEEAGEHTMDKNQADTCLVIAQPDTLVTEYSNKIVVRVCSDNDKQTPK